MGNSSQTQPQQSPYRGIHPFRYQDEGFFFGREKPVTELVAKAMIARLVLLFGESGSGKSSLINAGLIPTLEEEGFCPLRIRVRPIPEEPIQIEWTPTRAEIFIDRQLPGAGSENREENMVEEKIIPCSLDLFLESVFTTDAYPVLIFDQFEELFTLFGHEGDNVQEQCKLQDDLLNAIVQIVSNETLRAKIILVIRDDYLARLEILAKDFKLFDVFDYRVVLRDLNQDEAIQAILGPFEIGKQYPSCLTGDLADELVKGLAQEQRNSYIRPTHLQIVCDRLWQSYAGLKTEISVDDYEGMKEMKGILEGFLESELAPLESTQRTIAYGILTHLVTERGTRDVVSDEKLRDPIMQEEQASDQEFNDTLRYLAEHRLVDGNNQRGTIYYEITSEYLIPAIERKKQQLALQREREKAQEQAELERAALKRSLIGALALLFALLLLVIFILSMWRRTVAAEAQKRIYHADSLALLAVSKLAEEPGQALSSVFNAAFLRLDKSEPITPLTEDAFRQVLQTIRVRHILEGHKTGILGTAFSTDGTTLATAGSDGTVKIWDTSSGQEVRTIEVEGEAIRSFDFSPDEVHVAMAGSDGVVRVRNIFSDSTISTVARLPATLRDESSEGDERKVPVSVLDVVYGPQGAYLATGSNDGKARIWNAETGHQILTLEGHTRPVNAVAFSPDGEQLLTGSSDRTAKLWDIATGRPLRTFGSSHSGEVRAVAFTLDGKVLATAGADGIVRMWATGSGREQGLLKGHDSTINGIAFSEDGARLATSSADGSVRVWDVGSRSQKFELLFKLTGHTGKVNAAAFSPDGDRLASIGADSTARLWDIGPVEEEIVLPVDNDQIRSIVYGPDGRLYAAGTAKMVQGFDLTVSDQKSYLFNHGAVINDIALSPSGQQLASVGNNGIVCLWDLDSGRQVREWPGHDTAIWDVAYSLDGKFLATAGDDGNTLVWNVDSGELEHSLSGQGDAFLSLAFSPDEKSLVTAGTGGQAIVWNIASGDREANLSDQSDGTITSVAYSPLGKYLAAAKADGNTIVWDVTSGELVLTLKGHTEQVNRVAFNRDGNRLVSGSADGTLRIWDISTGALVSTLTGHTGAIRALAISPDGKFLVSGGTDEMIRVYILDQMELMRIASKLCSEIEGEVWVEDLGESTCSEREDQEVSYMTLYERLKKTMLEQLE